MSNIYSKEELETSDQLKTLENYSKVFNKFLTKVIWLESVINNCLAFDETTDDEMIRFLRKNCSDCEPFDGLAEMINKTEIKHPQNSKSSKFTLKLYVFVYSQLTNFPVSSIGFETITITSYLKTLTVSLRSIFIRIILT